MNNNITEDYCSFEVSKLLKEKGFSILCSHYYFEDGEFKQNEIRDTTGMDYGSDIVYNLSEFNENWNDKFLTKKNGDRCLGCSKSKGYFETFSSPTHALAIKWIRENFGIYIFPDPVYDFSVWTPRIVNKVAINSTHDYYKGVLEFISPEAAIEAALLYTLQNLIK